MATTAAAVPAPVEKKVFGYLPEDTPPVPALLSLGFQHTLTMFPATVLCAILIGFPVSATLFASGLATIVAVLGSRRRIPMYYGSSFSYIAPVAPVVAKYGPAVAQVGIVATGIINVLAGVLVQAVGKARLDKVLPPVVTGSVAIVIGVALSSAAIGMASANWTIAVITLAATILFSVYLQGKGLIGMLPVLLGAVVGYLIALFTGLVDFTPVSEAAVFSMPEIAFPAFTNPNAWGAAISIALIAIATIPESTAHLYQIGLYSDRLAEEQNREKPSISKLIGLNLVLDGVSDMVNGMLGASAGTNYGENNSLMAITKNYSSAVMVAAGVFACLLAFIGKLSALVSTLPVFVTGGLAIYLFGVIGLQGAALMMAEKVDLFNPRNLAIGAVILVIGLGGGENVTLFGNPASIAVASIAGIALNLAFLIFDRLTGADK